MAEASSVDPAGRGGEPPGSPAANPHHLLLTLDGLSDDELDFLLSTQS